VTTPTVSKPGLSREQISALTMSTLAFAVNFAVWVMFSVIGIKIKAELNLNETEFGLLVATPILTGSLVRLPLGILTDRYGGRIVYFLQMLAVVIPTWMLSYATEYWQYLALGLFIGVAGGSFAVASPTPRPGSARSGRARRWAFSAPATRAPRSPSSSPR